MLELNEEIIKGALGQLTADEPNVYFGLTSIILEMNKIYLTNVSPWNGLVKRNLIKQLDHLVDKGEVEAVLISGDVRVDFEYCRGYRLKENKTVENLLN